MNTGMPGLAGLFGGFNPLPKVKENKKLAEQKAAQRRNKVAKNRKRAKIARKSRKYNCIHGK